MFKNLLLTFNKFSQFLSGFVQAYIITDDFYVVGALFSGMNEDDFNTFEQNSPSDKTCYIYRSKRVPEMFLCLCKIDVDPEQAYSWTDQVNFRKIENREFSLVFLF